MPRLPNVPSHLRLRLIGLCNGIPWNSVQYAKYQGSAPTAADLLTVGTQVGSAWNSAIAQLVTPTTRLDQVAVEDLSSLDAATALATTSHPGLRAGTALPNNCALVASYKINARYRGGHPRTYWPAGAQTDVTAGHLWAGAFLTLAQGACTDYVGDINAITLGGFPLVFSTISFYEHNPNGAGLPSVLRPSPVPFVVQSVAVHTRVDTMRRRLGRESA
jgi:hypothetical protein